MFCNAYKPDGDMMRTAWIVLTVMLLAGCAGVQRDCSAMWASNIGADWIIVQYRMDGTPIYCWKLKSVAITNEERSDGIFWKDSRTGHLIHLSGWYNRVQVVDGEFDGAAALIGAESVACK